MRHIRECFSRLPENEDATEAPEPLWFQRSWERSWLPGDQHPFRVVVGDLSAEAEHDFGDYQGLKFGIDISLWENTGQFAYDNDDRWHDHSVTVILWRWGVYFAWRGGRKAVTS